ncbi:hypothetical protein [Saccharopolyspora hattusasensis]|uniref:hypothetical protein n=1 Tax=Saccharopolyspora hattusasensis TaxID=1128679 RepID=UPI003D9989D8
MSDRVVSLLRTAVPAVWSALLAYLVTLGTPPAVTDVVGGLYEPLVWPLVLAGYYALLRFIEPRLPAWLTRVLLGSTRAPSYGGGSIAAAEYDKR